MVDIDHALLQKIAHLAQLDIVHQDEEAMLQDLNHIVHWIEKLQEVDTQGVVPLVTMAPEQDIVSDDVPLAPLAHAKALVNAPSKDTDYFRVPKVKD